MNPPSILNEVLLELPSVAEAPSYSAMEARAERRGVDIEIVLEEERVRHYKALDSRGNVWEIQNPALITAQIAARVSPVILPFRKMRLTRKEAERESGGAVARPDFGGGRKKSAIAI